MTQDAMPADSRLIENLIEPLGEELVGVSYARQLPASDCDFIERYTRRFNYPEESRIKGKEDIPELGIKTFFCSNVCAAYRRDVYEALGGFSRRTIFNEDMILAGRMVQAGYKVAYAAGARVIHSHNYSGLQQFHRNFDLAVSQADNPEVFSMALLGGARGSAGKEYHGISVKEQEAVSDTSSGIQKRMQVSGIQIRTKLSKTSSMGSKMVFHEHDILGQIGEKPGFLIEVWQEIG